MLICISVWLMNISTELDFISNTCGLVHGDVSINNLVIVRLLPNILSSIPSVTSGSDEDKDKDAEMDWDVPCANEGLAFPLQSGGSLIDFDYSCAKDILSVKASVSSIFTFILSCTESQLSAGNITIHVPQSHGASRRSTTSIST